MSRPVPLLASESTAAALLDLKPSEFRKLVVDGHLPRGREVAPGLLRWSVDELRRIASGEAARPHGGLDL